MGRWQVDRLASLFRGVFYETIYPESFNLNHSATNVESLIRWDAQKRRALVSLSRPLRENPKWRFQAGFDLRNENWDVRDSSLESAPLLASLNLRKEAASAGITCFQSGRWNWSTAVEFSHRDYRNVIDGSALGPESLLQGYQLKHMAQLNYQLLRVPERRFVTSAIDYFASWTHLVAPSIFVWHAARLARCTLVSAINWRELRDAGAGERWKNLWIESI